MVLALAAGVSERKPSLGRALVEDAEQYLRLRGDSWRLRASALRGASMGRLRDADQVERASLEALARARPMMSRG